jgi:hypothetical protein
VDHVFVLPKKMSVTAYKSAPLTTEETAVDVPGVRIVFGKCIL